MLIRIKSHLKNCDGFIVTDAEREEHQTSLPYESMENKLAHNRN